MGGRVIMKVRIIVIVLLISLVTYSTVYAADPLYRMTNPEYFPGDQDAMILGQIISLEDDVFLISVLKTINGSVDSDTIQVDGKFTYLGFSQEHYDAKVGDFCIIALKKYDDVYKVIYPDRAVLADSGDYKTLKCFHDEENPQGGDVPAIQWYVNSGGTENGFGFSSGRAYVTRPNGETVDITDIAATVAFDQSGNMTIIDLGNNIIPNPITSMSFDSTGIAIILILIGMALLLVKRKAFKVY